MIPDELRGQLTCSVPAAGRALSLGRDSAYAAAARGEIPTLRLGRRLVVPVSKLLELLGIPVHSESAAATAAPLATTEPMEGAQDHGDTAPRLRNAS